MVSFHLYLWKLIIDLFSDSVSSLKIYFGQFFSLLISVCLNWIVKYHLLLWKLFIIHYVVRWIFKTICFLDFKGITWIGFLLIRYNCICSRKYHIRFILFMLYLSLRTWRIVSACFEVLSMYSLMKTNNYFL